MNANDIDWQRGYITLWDLTAIDANKPLWHQLSELKEDLAQIEYAGELLIDVGWYPEFSAKGAFRVVVVKGKNWTQPLTQETCTTLPDLIAALNKAVAFVQKITPKGSDEN